MDCLPLTNSAGSEDEKIEECCDGDLTKSSDINMESCTNPPTPASVMQVQLCHDIRLLYEKYLVSWHFCFKSCQTENFNYIPLSMKYVLVFEYEILIFHFLFFPSNRLKPKVVPYTRRNPRRCFVTLPKARRPGSWHGLPAIRPSSCPTNTAWSATINRYLFI